MVSHIVKWSSIQNLQVKLVKKPCCYLEKFVKNIPVQNELLIREKFDEGK